MSQFILFKLKDDTSELSSIGVQVQSISELVQNKIFYIQCCNIVFPNSALTGVYTILNFDDICVQAQESLSRNDHFKDTMLWKVINELKSQEIFFWYANEIYDLDEVNSFEYLEEVIEEMLGIMSGEFYIHYTPRP